ncbi:MAG: NAD(P)-dependent oxidoreductase [Lachnospiraceae bacterium]|nr:NAD(P)-dependent oxidoreductase [Lachnospiraceae bacterium]
MNIIITGVSSFIGRALSRQLISEGYEVYGVVRPDSKNKAGLSDIRKLHIIECDISECERLADVKLPPMYACVHLSWGGTTREGRQNPEINAVNETDTLRMVRTAKKLGCERFIFAGSQAEYGVTLDRVNSKKADGGPVDEKYPCSPLSEYGKSKLKMLSSCTSLCREMEMTYIHLRIFSTYGEGDHPTTLVSSCVKAFSEDTHIELTDCRQLWNMLNIRDCAKAISDMVGCVFTFPDEETPEDHVVNIASEDTRPLYEFVEAIHKRIGRGSCSFTRISESPEGTPYLNPDITKLKALTGFVPQVSFDEGLDRILEDMASHS